MQIFNSNTAFWIIWGIELVFMLWWLFDDLKLQYISHNPMIPVLFLYLFGALVIRLAFNSPTISMMMVGIGAVPLAMMGLFLLGVFIASLFGPIRWN